MKKTPIKILCLILTKAIIKNYKKLNDDTKQLKDRLNIEV